MFRILFILFLVIPLMEIAILIETGKVLGAGYTILLVISTAALGAALLRRQGLSALARIRTSMDQGRLPAVELVEGLILLIAGALLLTPGFVTDAFGFLLLAPALRQFVALSLLNNVIRAKIRARQTQEGNIIEGEYQESDRD